jgi:Family of unknown function (DUF6270)
VQKIFIYGSCVTRDGVEWWPDYGFELDGYVARQSLISSQSVATEADANFTFKNIESSFQRRMGLGDLGGDLVTQIENHKAEVIVWDLCDERNGVRRLPSGNILTHNVIYKGAKMGGEIIRFGEDEHFELWTNALDVFLERTRGRRIIVNATPWATVNDAGRPINGNASDAIAFNTSAERYFAELAARGLEIIRVDQNEALALSTHKWGEAPFHYVEGTYHAFLKQLKALIS